MTRTTTTNRLVAVALTSALATTALTGCPTQAAPPAGEPRPPSAEIEAVDHQTGRSRVAARVVPWSLKAAMVRCAMRI